MQNQTLTADATDRANRPQLLHVVLSSPIGLLGEKDIKELEIALRWRTSASIAARRPG